MTHVFGSLDEALDYISGEVIDLNAEALVAQSLAIAAFRAAAAVSDVNALSAEARLQIEHVSFAAGDAGLNASVKTLAREKLEAILSQLERPMM